MNDAYSTSCTYLYATTRNMHATVCSAHHGKLGEMIFFKRPPITTRPAYICVACASPHFHRTHPPSLPPSSSPSLHILPKPFKVIIATDSQDCYVAWPTSRTVSSDQLSLYLAGHLQLHSFAAALAVHSFTQTNPQTTLLQIKHNHSNRDQAISPPSSLD